MIKTNHEEFLDKYAQIAEKNNIIDTEHYKHYNVKRGLRNSDGTGVLVGLTEIGDVHGYILDEGESIPVEGRLKYRGIAISEIVNGFQKDARFGFEEVCFLLLFGKLPDETELTEFTDILGKRRFLPKKFKENMILNSPSINIMNKLARSVLGLYSYDPNPENLSVKNVLSQCLDLIAFFPIIAGYSYQAKRHYFDKESLFIHAPDPGLSTSENLLKIIRADMKFTKLEAELLDLCMVLHAEHGGGNNSAFTVHVISSAATDTYSAISAALGSLKGARHGGANVKVMEMIEDIKKNVDNWTDEGQVADYLVKILEKKAFDNTGLIYGMGHAVYTLSDPRAVLLKSKAIELSREKGKADELKLYEIIDKLTPELFRKIKKSSKPIAPNVDFYSGFVYQMLNIPYELFTPIFAIARIAGWSAHRLEEVVKGGRIMRPAYKSVIGTKEYIPLKER